MSLLFIVAFLIASALGSVVIDCTFPCKVTTEACVVTSSSIKCAPVGNNQWILRSRNSIPVFQGTLAAVSQSCQPVPFPTLKNATSSDINSTETIIEWPPVNTRNPYDKYLGNCESNSFCSDQIICIQRYPQGHYCESTHQCAQGSLCTEYTCQATTNFYNTESGGINTIHIIAAIVGVVLAIIVLLAIYLFRQRRNRTDKSTEDQKLEDATEPSSSSSTSSPTFSTLPSSMNQHQQFSSILPYESHFENNNNNNSSPSQQQQELQYQLQRQAYQDNKETVVPPPPYTP